MRIVGRPALARYFDNSDGVLPPSGEVVVPVVVQEERTPSGRSTCEGCGCSLDTTGKIIRRGEGLKKYLALEDEIKDLRKVVDNLQAENRELSAQLAKATAKPKRSIFM